MITDPPLSFRRQLQPTLIGYHESLAVSSGKCRKVQEEFPCFLSMQRDPPDSAL
jgi:hypothetical protein